MKRRVFKKTEESVSAEEAVEAGVETAEAVSAEAPETPAPKKSSLAKRAAYKGLYGVAYGTVFTSLLLRKLLVPKGGMVEGALHDGAVAARHDFEEKEKLIDEAFEETHKETAEILSVEELPAAAV